MASMLAAASSFFNRTNISQSYNIGAPTGFGSSITSSSSSRSSTPGPSSSSSPSVGSGTATSNNNSTNLPTPSLTPTFHVGLWKVQPATHKVTGKRVSVWTFDKKSAEVERAGSAKDRIIEALKAEASALGRLRHPSVLEMVEPLEETRSEITFATEPLLSSLLLAIPTTSRSSRLVELDEVEIQKGIIQLCKGLSFLHTSARLIHSNLHPESILINSSGDWKIGGLGQTIPLAGVDGAPTRWTSPMHDSYVPAYIQRSYDYIAPEYALDERLVTASDMYSLGCVIYAVHNKGNPPFRNHNNPASLRENSTRGIPNLERAEPDLKALLASLVTRQPDSRPTPSSLPTYPFFSSLSISTLNFLDRSTFASKTREEKISFMKGLTSVLDRFSDGLKTRKILPSLVEEMKDTQLLPYILPNVFAISQNLTPTQFGSLVLPSLKPLFAIKEPPQNMLTLLENLTLLQNKTDKAVFREHVLPLVYNALESEHTVVQERALKVVPDLCDSIDYAEVQGVLFPRVALVFTKTRILSVKVTTLQTFLAMVKTLDQTSLTQKLVPLLSRIRTKEPAVMLATLAVQEAMGMKVDREAVATLVLPQLWTMSMGPLLNVDQYQRFIAVIHKLGERVEREHLQYLRDSQRIEDRSGLNTSPDSTPGIGFGGNVDFESLVAGAKNATVKPDVELENGKGWEDDVWGSILASEPNSSPSFSRAQSPPTQNFSSTKPNLPPPLTATSLSSASPSVLSPPLSTGSRMTQTSMSFKPPTATKTIGSQISTIRPDRSFGQSLPSPLAPMRANSSPVVSQPIQPVMQSKPNYNITLPPAPPLPLAPSIIAAPPPLSMGVLQPDRPAQSWSNSSKLATKDDWGDFDPLS